jgi:homoserine O-acetyltransferase/O-succinyltransferase
MTAHTTRPDPHEGVFTLHDFIFESGQTLNELSIGYVRYGELNARRDNLLLVLPGTGNVRHSVIEHIGPGRAYDTNHYCVISTDAIGGGNSSKPADGLGAAFPDYSIRDMVHAQVKLVRNGLGLGDQPIAVLAGASMGAFQALEWIIHYPDMVHSAVLLVPDWHASQSFKLATQRMFDIVKLDPKWNQGSYQESPSEGLSLAGKHYFAWTVTDQYIAETDFSSIEQEAQAAGNGFASWDAWSLLKRYQASSRHDVSAPFDADLAKALERVKARTLVLPCNQERLLSLEGAKQIAAGIKSAVLAPVDSSKGHLAWRALPGSPQTKSITWTIRAFLNLDTQ